MDSDENESTGGETPKNQKDESNTALLPKSFFGSKDLKVGHKCTIEIVRLFEDEAEVKYLEEETPEEEKTETPQEEQAEASPADQQLESMATEK